MLQDSLPINAVCSTPPDGSLDYGSAVSEAAASYARLFPAESAATGGTHPLCMHVFVLSTSGPPSQWYARYGSQAGDLWLDPALR